MTDPKDRPKPPVVKTREPGKKPGFFDNIRQPASLPSPVQHPIVEILGLETGAESTPAPSTSATIAGASDAPARFAPADPDRHIPAPSVSASAEHAQAESTPAGTVPVDLASVDPAPALHPGERRQSTPRREKTRPDRAPADSTRALPALAYDLEGLSNLRRYVAREHWIDDEVFQRFRLSAGEQAMMRQVWRLTLGWGRLAAICSMDRMAERCVMSVSAAKQVRKSLVSRGLVSTEGRSDGPLDARGQVWRLLAPAIPPAELAGILEACETAKAQAEAETARVRSARAVVAAADSGHMKSHEAQQRNWSVDRLQTIAVQMIDDARLDGEGKPSAAEIERELRKTLRRVGAQAGVEFQDSDVMAVAAKWGGEGY